MSRGQVLNRDFRSPFVASGVLSSLAPNGKVINQDLTPISCYFLTPGKRKSGKTRKGSPWLRATLVEAAWGATPQADLPRRPIPSLGGAAGAETGAGRSGPQSLGHGLPSADPADELPGAGGRLLYQTGSARGATPVSPTAGELGLESHRRTCSPSGVEGIYRADLTPFCARQRGLSGEGGS